MAEMQRDLERADRLAAITQQIGFCVWQLQELEGSTARFLVLTTQLTPFTSQGEASELEQKALGRTFGTTLRGLTQANLLPDELQLRFNSLLAERNWLIHSSRATSRSAIHSDQAASLLIERITRISDEALALHHKVGELFYIVAENHGLNAETIQQAAQELLRAWHNEHAV